MQYYSDVTKCLYKTAAELEKAEAEIREKEAAAKKAEEKKAKDRKDRAALVEARRKAYEKARQEYFEQLNSFCKDYGAYHYSIGKDEAEQAKSATDWMNSRTGSLFDTLSSMNFFL